MRTASDRRAATMGIRMTIVVRPPVRFRFTFPGSFLIRGVYPNSFESWASLPLHMLVEIYL
jgi:hypothetical protein